MRVDWIIPCKYVEVVNGLATIVGAGADTHHVPTLPIPVVVTFAVRLTGPKTVGASNHRLSAQILDPQMQPTQDPLQADFRAEASPSAPGDAETHAMLAMQARFLATAEGLYTLSVAVDDRSESVCIRVVREQSTGH